MAKSTGSTAPTGKLPILSHVYADDDDYTIKVSARDEDNRVIVGLTPVPDAYEKELQVNVVDVAADPVISIDPADEAVPFNRGNVAADVILEEQEFTVRLTAGDPGADRITEYEVDFGDGIVKTVPVRTDVNLRVQLNDSQVIVFDKDGTRLLSHDFGERLDVFTDAQITRDKLESSLYGFATDGGSVKFDGLQLSQAGQLLGDLLSDAVATVNQTDGSSEALSLELAPFTVTDSTFNATGHGLSDGDTIQLTSDGTLPSQTINVPLPGWTSLFVVNANADDFQLSPTTDGAAIDLFDQGTGTLTFHLSLDGVGTEFTVNETTDLFLATAHGLTNGTPILLKSTETLPSQVVNQPLPALASFFVVNANTDDFQLSDSQGGTPITLSDTGVGNHAYSASLATSLKSASFTVDVEFDKFESANHGLQPGDAVTLSSQGVLPGIPVALSQPARLFVINKTDGDFQLSRSPLGEPIDLINAGSGTLSFEPIPAPQPTDPPTPTPTLTVDADTDRFQLAAHGLDDGDELVLFTTTQAGMLPAVATPITSGRRLFVISDGFDGNNFRLSETVDGTAVDILDDGTGQHQFRSQVTFALEAAGFTVDSAANRLQADNHGLSDGDAVVLASDGELPQPLAAQQTYFVVNATVDDFQIAQLQGGSAIDLADSGTLPSDTATHRFQRSLLAKTVDIELNALVPPGKQVRRFEVFWGAGIEPTIKTLKGGTATTIDPATDTITLTNHQFVNGDLVAIEAGVRLPGEILSPDDDQQRSVAYHVVTATDNTFQLSLTRDGNPTDIRTSGDGKQVIRLAQRERMIASHVFDDGKPDHDVTVTMTFETGDTQTVFLNALSARRDGAENDLPSTSRLISLPLLVNEGDSYFIDWGDGTTINVTNPTGISYTYPGEQPTDENANNNALFDPGSTVTLTDTANDRLAPVVNFDFGKLVDLTGFIIHHPDSNGPTEVSVKVGNARGTFAEIPPGKVNVNRGVAGQVTVSLLGNVQTQFLQLDFTDQPGQTIAINEIEFKATAAGADRIRLNPDNDMIEITHIYTADPVQKAKTNSQGTVSADDFTTVSDGLRTIVARIEPSNRVSNTDSSGTRIPIGTLNADTSSIESTLSLADRSGTVLDVDLTFDIAQCDRHSSVDRR